MSLQVCVCGWSKVTTYHGLRIHQGRMGCTPKGMKVEEDDQQYMWGNVGCTNQLEFKLDAYFAVDITQCCSNTSLQVCHYCGWSKVTTYRGLRIHQGKMGCTPEGVRIPEKEQHDWKLKAERKHQPTKRATVKKENTPLPPSTRVRTSSAAATAMIKQEHKSPFSDPQHSSQRATKSRRQWQDFPTGAQMETSAREPPAPASPVRVVQPPAPASPVRVVRPPAPASPVRVVRPPAPASPERVVRPKEKDWRAKTISQKADGRTVAGSWSNDFATTAARVKEEPESPLAIQQWSSSRAKNSNSVCRPYDWAASFQDQNNMLVREHPSVPPPEKEQHDWKLKAERKHQPTKRATVKKENTPLPPSTRVRTSSAAATAMIKQEHKSPFSDPQHSSQRATKSHRQRQDFPTGAQMETSAREPPAPASPVRVVQPPAPASPERVVRPPAPASPERVVRPPAPASLVRVVRPPAPASPVRVVRPPAPASPERVVRPKEKDWRAKTISQKADGRTVAGSWSNDFATTAARVKEEPESPLAIQQWSSSRAKNSNSVCRPYDWAASFQDQNNMLVREHPSVPPQLAPPQPQERDRKTLPQVKPLVRERPTTSRPAAAVRPEEIRRKDQTSPQNVAESLSINSAVKVEPKSPPQHSFPKATNSKPQDFCAAVPANGSRGERPTTPPLATVSQPEEKNRKDRTMSQVRDERFKSELQQKIQLREEKMNEIRALERSPETVPNTTSTNTQSKSAAAAATTREDPKTPTESESSSPDFSAGMKVKELAQMFSSATSQEAAVQPKGKHREELIQSQVKLTDQKLSATTEQETAVQPKEEEKEVQSVSQNVSDSTSATTQTNPPSAEATAEQEEDQKSSCEAEQPSDFSTGVKVKELARMFSATANQETAVLPKVIQREERKLPQNVSDSTSATTQTNPPSAETTAEQEEDQKSSCEAEQPSDFSTAVKVKELARMFSATANQETAVLPKVIQKEERKLPQVKLIAQRLLAAAQETVVQPKDKDETDQSNHSGRKAGSNHRTPMGRK
uniref:serine/arginine repetitive matrix protein 1-like isoform X2 n=1 Tax=Scatophagus argus TaxID=75038 RepID=UPI001ED7D093|nr:serine/arginine repetitive matrix protein 1-like isoform X2 [Scatophagus argus]